METKFEPTKSDWTIIKVSYFEFVLSALNVAKKRRRETSDLEKLGTNILKESRMGTKVLNGRERIAVLYYTYNSFPFVLS